MKTRNILRHLLRYLALIAGLIVGPVWAQGTTPQTLTWTGTTNEILPLNVAYPLGATASSGLPVTLRVDTGPAVVADGKITVKAFGTVVVTAEQAGNATYAATKLTRSLNVRHAVFSPVGRLDTVGGAHAVQVVGNLAYVADGQAGLQVLDVTDPASPVRVGRFAAFGEVLGVQVVGNHAYVADGDYGLQVIDVSNPTRLGQVGGYVDPTFYTSGYARGVQVTGNYAYVADDAAGLQVIDVSNPARPVRVGEYRSSGQALDVQVVGNRAYVAYGEAGLQIIELRSGFPQTLQLHLPAEISFYNSPVASAVTADSGLPLTLSVVSGPATVVDNQLVLTGLGPVTLRAEQAGDADHLPASAQWTVTVTPPRLGVRRVGAQVELFWAAGVAGLQLQGRESLSPDSPWQNLTTPPVEVGGEARLRLDATASQRFFRLLKP